MKITAVTKACLVAKVCVDDSNKCAQKLVALVYSREKHLDFSNTDETKYITEISSNAFKNTVGVESVILPKTTQVIKEFAFKNCADLKAVELVLEENFAIESNAFEDCKNLDSVCIKCNKLTIEKDAFIGCSNLRSIFIDCSELNLRKDAFMESSETTVYGKMQIGSCNLKDYCKKIKIGFIEVGEWQS